MICSMLWRRPITLHVQLSIGSFKRSVQIGAACLTARLELSPYGAVMEKTLAKEMNRSSNIRRVEDQIRVIGLELWPTSQVMVGLRGGEHQNQDRLDRNRRAPEVWIPSSSPRAGCQWLTPCRAPGAETWLRLRVCLFHAFLFDRCW